MWLMDFSNMWLMDLVGWLPLPQQIVVLYIWKLLVVSNKCLKGYLFKLIYLAKQTNYCQLTNTVNSIHYLVITDHKLLKMDLNLINHNIHNNSPQLFILICIHVNKQNYFASMTLSMAFTKQLVTFQSNA